MSNNIPATLTENKIEKEESFKMGMLLEKRERIKAQTQALQAQIQILQNQIQTLQTQLQQTEAELVANFAPIREKYALGERDEVNFETQEIKRYVGPSLASISGTGGTGGASLASVPAA